MVKTTEMEKKRTELGYVLEVKVRGLQLDCIWQLREWGVRFWLEQVLNAGVCYLLRWGGLGRSLTDGELPRTLCLMCCFTCPPDFPGESYTDSEVCGSKVPARAPRGVNLESYLKPSDWIDHWVKQGRERGTILSSGTLQLVDVGKQQRV